MNKDTLRKHGHRLSHLLRHGAIEAKLTMDAAGWAPIEQVLARTSLSRAELDAVVSDNNKQRYELRGDQIRAAQGHSIEGTPVTHEALEASWRRYEGQGPIWHGTHMSAVASIAQQGIVAGARTHVHLAAAPDSTVGKRAQVDVLLEVSPSKLREAGWEVFKSPNGVLLARVVPSFCIVGLRALSAAARSQQAILIEQIAHSRSA